MATGAIKDLPVGLVGKLMEDESHKFWRYNRGPIMVSPRDQLQLPFEEIEEVFLTTKAPRRQEDA